MATQNYMIVEKVFCNLTEGNDLALLEEMYQKGYVLVAINDNPYDKDRKQLVFKSMIDNFDMEKIKEQILSDAFKEINCAIVADYVQCCKKAGSDEYDEAETERLSKEIDDFQKIVKDCFGYKKEEDSIWFYKAKK